MVDPLSILLTGGETVAGEVADAATSVADQVADGGLMLQTIGMGLGTVFVGLICLIFICSITSAIVRKLEGLKGASADAVPAPAPVAPAQAVSSTHVSAGTGARSAYERGALSAVIAVAVAEELGTDVSGIRIVSIKKV